MTIQATGSTLAIDPQRILIIMPTWLGDAVMATPTLHALRDHFPNAHITALIRGAIKPILAACPWIDRVISVRPPRPGMYARRPSSLRIARRLAAGRFDLAVLLPNSFRIALIARLAAIPRRIGYVRDARGFLLTDRLFPPRQGEKFIPYPALDYYLDIARHLGAANPDPAMRLFTWPDDDRIARDLLLRAGFDAASGRRLVILAPGAANGDAKMWLPDRFAAVADRCVTELGAAVALTGSPDERPILDQVHRQAKHPLIDLPRLGIDLTMLKSVVKSSHLVITNDTGARHLAAAFFVPVVTIFGPTDPAWTRISFQLERQVVVQVDCGPCNLKKCPLDHRCMTRITPDMVFVPVSELFAKVGATT